LKNLLGEPAGELGGKLGELCLFPVRRRWKQTATREFAPPFLLLLFHFHCSSKTCRSTRARFAAQKPTIAAQHSVRSA
jgi:hypothetical protein